MQAACLPPRHPLITGQLQQPAKGKENPRIWGRLLQHNYYIFGRKKPKPKDRGERSALRACAGVHQRRALGRLRLRRRRASRGGVLRPASRGARGSTSPPPRRCRCRRRRRARTHTERARAPSQCTTSRSPGRSYAERCRRGDAYSHSSMERCHCFDCR